MLGSLGFSRPTVGAAALLIAFSLMAGCSGESTTPKKMASHGPVGQRVSTGATNPQPASPAPSTTGPTFTESRPQSPPNQVADNSGSSRGENNPSIRTFNALSGCSFSNEIIWLNRDARESWAKALPLLAALKNERVKKVDVGFAVEDADMPALTQFPSLDWLDLSDCERLTDAGLKSIHDCRKLTNIDLSDAKKITGPGLQVLADVPGLTRISISDAKLSGQLGFLAKLKAMQMLNLHNCDLVDDDLKEIGRLSQLQFLTLYRNKKIGDAGLSHLGGLSKLQHLTLTQTGISNAGLKSLTALKLTDLNVNGTNVTDAGFVHLAGIPTLKFLDLEECKISDAGFKHLRACPELTHIKITKSPDFTGTGLQHLSPSGFYSLYLESTGIDNAGMAAIGRLDSLMDLRLPAYGDQSRYDSKNFWSDLHSDRLNDQGLKEVAKLKKLMHLYVSGGGITDAGLTHLSGLNELLRLKFGACPEITGPGLKSLAGLPNLRELDISQTNITDDQLKPLDSIASLADVRFGPGVTAKAVDDFKKRHPKISVYHETEFRSPAMLSLISGGPLTKEQTTAMDELKKLGWYVENTDKTKSLSSYSMSEKKYAEQLKHFKVLAKSSVNRLDLSFAISPEVFQELSKMTFLDELTLNDLSNVTDADFVRLANCKKLRQITLKKAPQLSASALATLTKLPKLEYVTLEEIPASAAGIAALQSSKSVTNVTVRKCELTDSDLVPLGEIVTLKYLDLTDCSKLTGTGLAAWRNTGGLYGLVLEGTACNDSSLASLTRFPNLSNINLDRTKVTDAGLIHLKPLRELSMIYLPRGNIRGSGLKDLGDLPTLAVIVFPGNPEFTGEGLEHLARTKITELDLSKTGINDAGLVQMAKLKKLIALQLPQYGQQSRTDDGKPTLWSDLQSDRLTDAGIKHLSGLTNLVRLDLSGGGITDASLTHLAGLTKLTSLRFGACPEIRGPGLASLKGMQKLETLDLQETPVTIEHLKHLDSLSSLHWLTIGPGITAKENSAYAAAHPKQYVNHWTEYHSPAMVALVKGGPLTQSELAAVQALKPFGFDADLNESSRRLSCYRLEEKSLPAIQKQLDALSRASFTYVHLDGKLQPDQWKWACGLKFLTELDCPDLSNITDADFAALAQSRKLTNVHFSKGEKLTPAAMKTLGALPNIDAIAFSKTKAAAAAPAAISGLTQLKTLWLIECDVADSDLAPLAALVELKQLGLSGNARLTGAGLKPLAALKNLNLLDLQGAGCTDDGLAGLAGMSNLTMLRLRNTKVTDAGLKHLVSLTKLRGLELPEGNIKGPGLVHLAGMTELRSLEVDGSSEFTGEQLQHLAKSEVSRLYLQRSGINDAGLARIAELKNLESLYLPRYGSKDPRDAGKFWANLHPERLTDKGLAHLAKLPELSDLEISGGGITDAGLEAIKKFPKLEDLQFANCPNIKGSGLKSLREMPSLKSLNLIGTQITNDSLANLAGKELRTLGLPKTVTKDALPHLKKIVGLQTLICEGRLDEAALKELKAAFPKLDVETPESE